MRSANTSSVLCSLLRPKSSTSNKSLVWWVFLVLTLYIYYVCPYKAWLNLFLSNANVVANFTSVFILILPPHTQKKKKHSNLAGIEPRSSYTASKCSIHYTLKYDEVNSSQLHKNFRTASNQQKINSST